MHGISDPVMARSTQSSAPKTPRATTSSLADALRCTSANSTPVIAAEGTIERRFQSAAKMNPRKKTSSQIGATMPSIRNVAVQSARDSCAPRCSTMFCFSVGGISCFHATVKARNANHVATDRATVRLRPVADRIKPKPASLTRPSRSLALSITAMTSEASSASMPASVTPGDVNGIFSPLRN